MSRWRPGNPEVEQSSTEYLVLDDEHEPDSPVIVAMRSENDHWVLGFHVGIAGERTLPEIEDFARRVRTFLEDEPVVPLDTG